MEHFAHRRGVSAPHRWFALLMAAVFWGALALGARAQQPACCTVTLRQLRYDTLGYSQYLAIIDCRGKPYGAINISESRGEIGAVQRYRGYRSGYFIYRIEPPSSGGSGPQLNRYRNYSSGYFLYSIEPGGSSSGADTVALVYLRGDSAGIATLNFTFYDPNGQIICEKQVIVDAVPGRPIGLPQCAAKAIVLNSGFDPRYGLLPDGSRDPLWTVVQDPVPGTIEPRPAWVLERGGSMPISQWLSPFPAPLPRAVKDVVDRPPSPRGVDYVYERCFCLQDTLTVRLGLHIKAVDTLVSVTLDNQPLRAEDIVACIAIYPPPPYCPSWQIDTVLRLLPGTHCLRFTVRGIPPSRVDLPDGAIDVVGSVAPFLQTVTGRPYLVADTCCVRTGWIIGQKIHDLNCNARIDAGEPPLQGWTITAQGPVTRNGITGSDGWYSIQVPPGTYQVSEQVQAGFNPSAGGPFVATVYPGSVSQFDFLNCTAAPRCDTTGAIQLDSACCTFTIPIYPVSAITSINWSVSGGYMERVDASPCGYTLNPPNPYNTTSGTINFNPPCNANPLLLTFEVQPTTASGVVQLTLKVNHVQTPGGVQVCELTQTLRCKRAPVSKCDVVDVKPFSFGDLNVSGRTFKITNAKAPIAQICKVQIALTPDPNPSDPNFKWLGGGLKIDGQPRPWTTGNSGIPYYSLIDCSGSGAPQGNPANSTIEFNLGVDYTLRWEGVVTLRIIHCDGDTCTFTYNWCAKPARECLRVIDTAIAVTAVRDTLRKYIVGVFGVKAGADKPSPSYTIIELDSSVRGKAEIVAAGIVLVDSTGRYITSGNAELLGWREDSWRGAYAAKYNWYGVREWATYYRHLGPWYQLWALVGVDPQVLTTGGGMWDMFIMTLYDSTSHPISVQKLRPTIEVSNVGFERIELTGSGGPVMVVPNPTTGELRVGYVNPVEGNVQVAVFDVLGNRVAATAPMWQGAGYHEQLFDLRGQPSGRYTVVVYLPNGAVHSSSVVVAR